MSSSHGSSKLRHKEREWKPRMKERGTRSKDTASGSALAAQMAMANIKDLNRQRDRGQEVDAVVLAKISQSLDTAPAETPTQQRRQAAVQAPSGKRSRVPLVAGLLGAVAGMLAVVAFLVLGTSRYSVKGTMRFEDRPLPGVELQFHAANGNFLPPRVTTSAEGTFSISGLPAGIYRVTLQPEDQSKVQVPLAYKQLESTPLRMKVDRNRENETLYAMQPRRR